MVVESLRSEFQHETVTTRSFLLRLPPDRWGWKPHPRSFAVGALAGHLADCIQWVEPIVTLDELDIDPATYRPSRPNSLQEMLTLYDEVVAAGGSALARLDAAQLTAPWRLKMRGVVRLERSKFDVLRDFTFNHLIHHRGQLSVYLRLLEVPVPGAYGPTADERD